MMRSCDTNFISCLVILNSAPNFYSHKIKLPKGKGDGKKIVVFLGGTYLYFLLLLKITIKLYYFYVFSPVEGVMKGRLSNRLSTICSNFGGIFSFGSDYLSGDSTRTIKFYHNFLGAGGIFDWYLPPKLPLF